MNLSPGEKIVHFFQEQNVNYMSIVMACAGMIDSTLFLIYYLTKLIDNDSFEFIQFYSVMMNLINIANTIMQVVCFFKFKRDFAKMEDRILEEINAYENNYDLKISAQSLGNINELNDMQQ